MVYCNEAGCEVSNWFEVDGDDHLDSNSVEPSESV